MTLDPRLDDLRLHADRLTALAEEKRAALAELLAVDRSLKIQSITARVKSEESLAGKLARPDRTYASLWDVTDLIGLRVITYFESDVERVGQLIESRCAVDFANSADKRKRLEGATFGYSSLHYVCTLRAGVAATPLPPRARYEIQVRTLLEHAWAEIEHDLGYKASASMPKPVTRRFQRLAGLLELADQEFTGIRDDLRDYARRLPSRIAENEDAVPLDLLSLSTFLQMDEVRALDARIARAMGKELGEDAFFPEYLLRMLSLAGVSTVGAAHHGLATQADAIVAMVEPYFAFAWASFHLSTEGMLKAPRGYSLFFLAHATVLRAETLGVNKTERLAHLYKELDYPDDAHQALRVASDLVAAFNRAASLPPPPLDPSPGQR